MLGVFRRLLACLAALAVPTPAMAQDDSAIILVAHPAFRDLEYRQTVVLAAPAPNGGHVGVILNRPTRRSLGSLFPEHAPSRKVIDPVYWGGPFSRGAVVALVKSHLSPGNGSIPVMKDLYLAFPAKTIDHVIETTPNDARYFVGFVGWKPGELAAEIEKGFWYIGAPDPALVFQKETSGMWEDLVRRLGGQRTAPLGHGEQET